ncbi:hypothetical protein BY996DRAFT_6489866 [Phakopsora pachyrhizi]|nr:hypothetical protein BY996DRAFT_6489866 [Phakopsora pachyrhizi]
MEKAGQQRGRREEDGQGWWPVLVTGAKIKSPKPRARMEEVNLHPDLDPGLLVLKLGPVVVMELERRIVLEQELTVVLLQKKGEGFCAGMTGGNKGEPAGGAGSQVGALQESDDVLGALITRAVAKIDRRVGGGVGHVLGTNGARNLELIGALYRRSNQEGDLSTKPSWSETLMEKEEDKEGKSQNKGFTDTFGLLLVAPIARYIIAGAHSSVGALEFAKTIGGNGADQVGRYEGSPSWEAPEGRRGRAWYYPAQGEIWPGAQKFGQIFDSYHMTGHALAGVLDWIRAAFKERMWTGQGWTGLEEVGSGGRRSWIENDGDITRAGGGCGGRFGKRGKKKWRGTECSTGLIIENWDEGVIVGENGWGYWKKEENLGGGVHQVQSDWSKITGAMGL